MDIYLIKENSFKDKEWTAEEKSHFFEENKPILTLYHDALKNGYLGF